jgi:hypothetical protein
MQTHRNAPQGNASHTEVHRDSGPARGSVSPLGGSGGPPETLHRDEDIASAPMERLPKNTVPEMNRRGGVTSIRGWHGPRGGPEDAT